MASYNFEVKFIGLDGKETETCVGEPLAETLAGKTEGIKSRKAYGWAKALYAGEPLNLDDQDKKDLMQFIENNENFTNAFKCQLLDVLE